MSYILDALKKAEADRDPEARASLAMAQHERRRSRWLIHAVVIALIANAAILLWLFLPEQSPRTAAPAPSEQQGRPDRVTAERQLPPLQASPAEQPTAPPRRSEASPPQPSAPNTMAAESATGETIIGPGTAPASQSASAPGAQPAKVVPTPVSGLPSAQRARFPTLEFSTHVYADDADLRAIVVNGTRLQEGDPLGDLRLEEITEEGAVFRFEGRLVSVSVLDAWN